MGQFSEHVVTYTRAWSVTCLKMTQELVAEANKTALETEKARDEFQQQIEQIEQQLHPKRVTHDDTGDALCEEVIQLLVQGMLACTSSRTWIQILRSKSLGVRV